MSRYIDAETLVKDLEHVGLSNGGALGHHSGKADIAAEIVHNQPTADVAPVVHGKWIERGNCTTECSVCGNTRLGRSSQWYNGELWTDAVYCGHCGAKMDGDADQRRLCGSNREE